MIIILLREILN